ncbi:MAG: malonyl-CoA synthase [Gammaproteobacteria bacterium]|nr:MAG: malonyl-CoA synthase [Gammaproteobacteria bacterium]
MDNKNLYLRFELDNFSHAKGRPFLMSPGREPLGYDDLSEACGLCQSRLVELDVKPGDRVMVQADKSYEAVVLYLACLRAGAIYIPLNTAYTENELEYFIEDARPQLLVCQPEKIKQIAPLALRLKVPYLRTLGTQGEGTLTEGMDTLDSDPEIISCDSDDFAAILYTSGTTGRSKGAMLTHANLQSNAEALHYYWRWDDENDVLLHALPIFHVHGLFVALHCALLGGSPVHFLPRFSTSQIIAKLPESTVMMGVPTFYTRLLDTPEFTRDVCKKMRLFTAGSAPLLAETHLAFEERTGHRILERYGMTEAGMITSNPYDGDRIAGTVGYPLPDIQVRVTDEAGCECPQDETGVLEVIGPNVFKGYWQMPEKTAAEFRDDGWFITGDLATMSDDGRITIVGRAKDLIISGGYNVYPKEIEAEIDVIEGVKESAVIGVPHRDFGEGVTAVVVLDGSKPVAVDDIKMQLSGCLAKFKQPKHIYFVDELPRNTMGKVQKADLRKTYQTTYD